MLAAYRLTLLEEVVLSSLKAFLIHSPQCSIYSQKLSQKIFQQSKSICLQANCLYWLCICYCSRSFAFTYLCKFINLHTICISHHLPGTYSSPRKYLPLIIELCSSETNEKKHLTMWSCDSSGILRSKHASFCNILDRFLLLFFI